MATKIECDVCKTQVNGESGYYIYKVDFPMLGAYKSIKDVWEKPMDFCANCLRKLNENLEKMVLDAAKEKADGANLAEPRTAAGSLD